VLGEGRNWGDFGGFRAFWGGVGGDVGVRYQIGGKTALAGGFCGWRMRLFSILGVG